MKTTMEETKFIVRCVLDYLSDKRAVFEPNGIAFHYRDMSVRKCITVYIKHSIGNSQHIAHTLRLTFYFIYNYLEDKTNGK